MTENAGSKKSRKSGPKKKKTQLIGSDPLAWLDNEAVSQGGAADSSDPGDPAPSETTGPRAIDFQLPETLAIADLENLYQELRSLLEDAEVVQLDASRVEKIDAVSMQMLTALCRSVPAAGYDIQWSNCSEAFTDAGKLLGLTESLRPGRN